jgi:hypothetical protein
MARSWAVIAPSRPPEGPALPVLGLEQHAGVLPGNAGRAGSLEHPDLIERHTWARAPARSEPLATAPMTVLRGVDQPPHG